MNDKLLDCIEHTTGPDPQRAVIWLHGLGADGHDFAPIVPQLDLTGAPDVRFVFPHAPVQPVTINGGMAMRAWYDIIATDDLTKREDEAGIRASAQHIEALIAREKERGVAAKHILLAGFSQGCAMALYTGLRHAETLAGVVALSGYLPLASSLAAERAAANAEAPIFMAHGTDDPVVPLARAEESARVLREAGYPVQWQTYPMPHAVHPAEVQDIAAFLRQTLI